MITVTKIILESEKISKQQYMTMIVVLSDHTNYATSCEVLLCQYSFANFGKYDERYMITVTKRILQSAKISKQQYIAIIIVVVVVVLSGHTNRATCCEVLLCQYSFANFGKYDEPYMITVTKIILESAKMSKQQYMTMIVVLSDNTNNATYCEVLLQQYSLANTMNSI
jgi:hypothetical protein